MENVLPHRLQVASLMMAHYAPCGVLMEERNVFVSVGGEKKIRGVQKRLFRVDVHSRNIIFPSIQGGARRWPNAYAGQLVFQLCPNIMLSAGKFNSISVYGPAGRFFVGTDENSGGPSVTVEDKEGDSGAFGRTDLEGIGTGRKTRIPAASA